MDNFVVHLVVPHFTFAPQFAKTEKAAMASGDVLLRDFSPTRRSRVQVNIYKLHRVIVRAVKKRIKKT